MTSSPSKFFPFDGKCELSKGSDLTLQFADKSTLHTHALLLAMVSPVLRTAIKDCKHSGSINVEEDCSTWRLALNLIHPSGPILSEKEVTDKNVFCLLFCGRSTDSSCLMSLSIGAFVGSWEQVCDRLHCKESG